MCKSGFFVKKILIHRLYVSGCKDCLLPFINNFLKPLRNLVSSPHEVQEVLIL